jgi:hypothetical protein
MLRALREGEGKNNVAMDNAAALFYLGVYVGASAAGGTTVSPTPSVVPRTTSNRGASETRRTHTASPQPRRPTTIRQRIDSERTITEQLAQSRAPGAKAARKVVARNVAPVMTPVVKKAKTRLSTAEYRANAQAKLEAKRAKKKPRTLAVTVRNRVSSLDETEG